MSLDPSGRGEPAPIPLEPAQPSGSVATSSADSAVALAPAPDPTAPAAIASSAANPANAAAAKPSEKAPPEAQLRKSKLSVPQMLQVMRVEFHRARSQRYPISCLMIAADGIDTAQATHGYQAKQLLMRAAYDLLRKTTGQHAFFGMVLMSGDRLMAVFPNTPPTRAGELGRLLIESSRGLHVEWEEHRLPVTLSIGASHNLLLETSTFERYVEMAGRSLAMARQAGGDRYVMWREAEAEIEDLRGELEASAKRFQQQHDELLEERASVAGLQEASIIDQIQRVFGSVVRTPDIARLEQEIVALAAKELFEERQKAVQAQVAEHQKQIDLLERRIHKLTEMLGVTEEELGRVMALKGIDPGVASIFRTVQGLSVDDGQAAVKKAMMADIFKANLAIQRRDAQAA